MKFNPLGRIFWSDRGLDWNILDFGEVHHLQCFIIGYTIYNDIDKTNVVLI